MPVKKLHIRLLRKMKLLKYLKLRSSLTLGKRRFNIPVVKGVGLVNLYVEFGWMSQLIQALDLKKDAVFVDVGVNLGQTLLQLRAVNPEVKYMGFEPNALCCSYVEDLIRLNELKNCSIFNLALSDTRALVDFEFDSEADPRASINLQQRPDYFSQKRKVQAVVFDEDYAMNKASVIKIDVEGAELAVLKGMQKQMQEHQPLIICEVLDSHGEAQLDFTRKQADELAALLHGMGYRILALEEGKDGKLLAFREQAKFEIKLWEQASLLSNDYIFYHPEKWPHLPEIIQNQLIHA